MTGKTTSYLEIGRLGEVLALIQVLAYDKNTSRSEVGLQSELKAKPNSEISWVALAKNHPEFFRVRQSAGMIDRVSLVARYVLPHTTENKKKIRPLLEPATVNKLMEIAITLHDRQVARSEKWKTIIPMIVALIAAGAAIAAAMIKGGA